MAPRSTYLPRPGPLCCWWPLAWHLRAPTGNLKMPNAKSTHRSTTAPASLVYSWDLLALVMVREATAMSLSLKLVHVIEGLHEPNCCSNDQTHDSKLFSTRAHIALRATACIFLFKLSMVQYMLDWFASGRRHSYVGVFCIFNKVLGIRMCPHCPHCNTPPGQDALGSVAELMPGLAGRPDAMLGAVECQKSIGSLHYHFSCLFNACTTLPP